MNGRTVMTAPAPGYTPMELTWEQAQAMAHLVVAALTEAGYPCETRPKVIQRSLFGPDAVDWEFKPLPGTKLWPVEVIDRARALAFSRFGLIDLVEVSDRED